MQYTLKDVKHLTSKAGKPFKKATANGVEVSIWPDFAQYEQAVEGATVDGIVRENGTYKNLVSELEKPEFVKRMSGGRSGASIAKAQDRKEEMIKQAQARKSDQIAFFNATNNAIALYSALNSGKEATAEDMQDFIRFWREWFLDEYERSLNPYARPETTSNGDQMPTF